MIAVADLTRRYGAFTAVDGASFVAHAGEVTGFLGPNGAGKSTTLRILVGLTRPDRGSATIGGHRFGDIPNPGRHVGVLLDASAQHPGRTGRETLTLTARTLGLPAVRVDQMLDTVSLAPSEAKRRVGNYSLGMRQRLGIANALLGDPQVLLLDEPANGLDPAGIRWMRDLLRTFAQGGGTVLLSSHLLHEVEQIADQIVVIGRGRILASGTKAELLAAPGCFVRSMDDAVLAAALSSAGLSVQPSGDGLTVAAEPTAVGAVALAAGVVLAELRPAGSSGLEDLFLELTADSQREAERTPGPAL